MQLLRYLVGAWSGRLLALVPFCSTRACGPVYLKRRRAEARFLIAPANAYLRLCRAGVEVLPEADWLRWEVEVHARANGADVRRRGRVLEIPALPGVPLDRVLRRGDDEQRRAALTAGFAALRRLHARDCTHADAAAHNSCWDPVTGRAHWFDFEMRHDPAFPVAWRRTEDARALALSASCFLPGGRAALVARALREGYPEMAEALPAHLRQQRLVSLQVVQAPWSPRRARALQAELATQRQ